MKAILIDSHKRTITPIELSEDDGQRLTEMQKAVEGDIEVAHEIRHKNRWNTFYVDEEGLFNEQNRDWFMVKGAHQPFKGNGLVAGYDPRSGNTIGTNMSVEDVKTLVQFADSNTVQLYVQMGTWK